MRLSVPVIEVVTDLLVILLDDLIISNLLQVDDEYFVKVRLKIGVDCKVNRKLRSDYF